MSLYTRQNHLSPCFISSSHDLFPRLSIEELRSQLSLMAIELPQNIFTHPNCDDVQGLYSLAIEDVFDKNAKYIRMEENTPPIHLAKIDGVDIVPFEGRLHIRAICNLRFFRFCQKLCFNVLGVYDFNRNFIFRPDSSSVIRFASAFVNFLRFREFIYNKLNTQIEQFTQLANHDFLQLIQQCEYYENELSKKTAERNIWEEEIREIKKSNNKMEIDLKTLYIQHQKQIQINNGKKNTALILQNENSEFELNLISLRQQLDDFKDEIVHSPQKLIEKQKELVNESSEKQKSLVKLQKKIVESRNEFDILQKAKEKIQKIQNILYSHPKQTLNKYLEKRLEKKEILKELGILKKEDTNLKDEIKLRKNKINKTRGKINQTEEEYKIKESEAKNKLENNKEIAKKQRERIINIENEINEINEEKERICEIIEEEISQNLILTNKINDIQSLLEKNSSNLISMYEEMRIKTANDLSGIICVANSSAAFKKNSRNINCNNNTNDQYNINLNLNYANNMYSNNDFADYNVEEETISALKENKNDNNFYLSKETKTKNNLGTNKNEKLHYNEFDANQYM